MLKHIFPLQSTKDYAGANIHVSVKDPKLPQVSCGTDVSWRNLQLMKDHAGAVCEGPRSGAGDQCEEHQRGAVVYWPQPPFSMVFLIKDKCR